MKKAIAVVIGVLALTFATMSMAFAAGGPTQSGTLTCTKGGATTFSSVGSVASVLYTWKNNNGVVIESKYASYSAALGKWVYSPTSNTAKTVEATVKWASTLDTVKYAKSCFPGY